MRAVITVELVALFLGAAVFVGRYLAVTGWWRTPAGRHMMMFTAGWGVFVGTLAVELAVPGQQVGMLAWTGILAGLVALMWAQVVLLFVLQRRERDG